MPLVIEILAGAQTYTFRLPKPWGPAPVATHASRSCHAATRPRTRPTRASGTCMIVSVATSRVFQTARLHIGARPWGGRRLRRGSSGGENRTAVWAPPREDSSAGQSRAQASPQEARDFG